MTGGPKSLGLATDILVLGNRAQLEPHPLGWVLRTPDEPDFWYGNQLILKGEPLAPDEAIAAFHEAFPQAEHVTLSWDAPERSLAADLDDLAERGFVIERDDVLSLEARPAQPVPPNGFQLREVESDDDWAKVANLKVEIGVEEGYADEGYRAFIRGRCDGWRKAIAAGEGAWFGAFEGETLAADLGLFTDGRIARFQSVETAAAYRRRGLCSALVVYALNWLAARAPQAQPVIVAEADGDAGRLYRRLGFALVERQTSALLRPEGY